MLDSQASATGVPHPCQPCSAGRRLRPGVRRDRGGSFTPLAQRLREKTTDDACCATGLLTPRLGLPPGNPRGQVERTACPRASTEWRR